MRGGGFGNLETHRREKRQLPPPDTTLSMMPPSKRHQLFDREKLPDARQTSTDTTEQPLRGDQELSTLLEDIRYNHSIADMLTTELQIFTKALHIITGIKSTDKETRENGENRLAVYQTLEKPVHRPVLEKIKGLLGKTRDQGLSTLLEDIRSDNRIVSILAAELQNFTEANCIITGIKSKDGETRKKGEERLAEYQTLEKPAHRPVLEKIKELLGKTEDQERQKADEFFADIPAEIVRNLRDVLRRESRFLRAKKSESEEIYKRDYEEIYGEGYEKNIAILADMCNKALTMSSESTRELSSDNYVSSEKVKIQDMDSKTLFYEFISRQNTIISNRCIIEKMDAAISAINDYHERAGLGGFVLEDTMSFETTAQVPDPEAGTSSSRDAGDTDTGVLRKLGKDVFVDLERFAAGKAKRLKGEGKDAHGKNINQELAIRCKEVIEALYDNKPVKRAKAENTGYELEQIVFKSSGEVERDFISAAKALGERNEYCTAGTFELISQVEDSYKEKCGIGFLWVQAPYQDVSQSAKSDHQK
jgi:hypothetical protein